MRPFRDLEVWQMAHALAGDVYRATRLFPREEVFGLTSQLRRASVSVPTNIVEGSVHEDRQFARYLRIALASAAETEYLLLFANDLNYLDAETHKTLESRTRSVQRMLVSFISTLTAQTPRTQSARRRPIADSRKPTVES